MNLFKISFQYLVARPLNTLLNMLILSLGVAIIVLLLLVSTQIERQLSTNAKGIDLVVGAKGSPLQLILSSIFHIDYPTGNIPLEEAQQLAQNPMVKYAIPLALGDSYRGFRIIGTNHRYAELYNANLQAGALWETDFEVTIGANVASELQLSVGDTFFGAHGMGDAVGDEHAEHAYRVVGVLARSQTVLDRLILTNVESIWEAHAHEEPETTVPPKAESQPSTADTTTHGAHHATAHGHEPTHTDTAQKLSSQEAQQKMLQTRQTDKDTGLPEGDANSEITSMLVKFTSPMGILSFPRFINQNTSMQSASPAYEVNRLFNLIGIGFDMLRAFAYLMVFIAALSIFIALYNALKERRYDLAVMRAMGASKGRLFLLVILESTLVTALSAVVGIMLGHVTLQVVGTVWETSGHVGVSGFTFLWEEIYVLVASLGLGVFTAFIPALQAYRTNLAAVLAEG